MNIPTETETARKARAALRELAADPVAVLAAAGIRGDRGCPRTCPVAEFLKLRTGDMWAVYGVNALFYGTAVELPPEVEAFVHQFDQGHHSEFRTRRLVLHPN